MMNSERKLRANCENARKSTGPRTPAGKSRASRNAVRHGLSSLAIVEAGYSERITRIANKLCENDPFPYRYDVALEIADAQVMSLLSLDSDGALFSFCSPESIAKTRATVRLSPKGTCSRRNG